MLKERHSPFFLYCLIRSYAIGEFKMFELSKDRVLHSLTVAN